MAKEPEPVRHVRAISEMKANMRLVSQAKNHYYITVDGGTEWEDLLDPGWWKHLARRFKKDWQNLKDGREPPDVLAVCENRSWRQLYEVRDVGPYHVKVLPVGDVCRYGVVASEDEPKATDQGDYRIFYTPGAKYIVRRKSDDEDLAKKLETRDEADAWLADYLEKLAA